MNRYLPFAATGVALAVVLAVALVPFGCGPSNQTKTTAKTQKQGADDPWPKLVAALRDDTDPQTCRQQIGELNTGLALSQSAEKPRAATAEEQAAVIAALQLGDAEAKFFAQAEYAPQDGNHLAECFYLRDAAKSLGVTATDPAAVRATAAFRWVCRQVVLSPWVFPGAQGPTAQPPVPPVFALRRGSGSGLERAYVFLALCRQLDLDAYLIGKAAADRTWAHQLPGKANEYPKGPFWGVGVRDGSDILLYDPWRGEPLPGKAAGKPATLAEVRKDPKVVAAWLDDKQTPWDVSADDLTGGEVYLSVPLSALAPRTAKLEAEVKADADAAVRAAVDWAAAVKAAEAASGGAAVKGWNPKTDRTTPVRGLGWFLPVAQGGLDDAPEAQSQFGKYTVSLIPQDRILVLPKELKSADARERLARIAFATYLTVFQTQPTPRERVQRGRHFEATKQMTKARGDFKQAVSQQAVAGFDAATAEWVQRLNALFDDLSKTKTFGDRSTRAADVAAKEAEIDRFLRNSPEAVAAIQGAMIGRPGTAEATYLLALSFHERAEAAEMTTERAGADKSAVKAAADGWAAAADWWAKYDEYRDEQNVSYPGRADHAKGLAARAAERLKARKALASLKGETVP